jgi:two-component system, NtrC family, response regulator GlrR
MVRPNSECNHRAQQRSSAGPFSILLWDCAPNCNWANQFERLILDGQDIKIRIRTVSAAAQCVDGESAVNPDALVLVTASIDETRGVTALQELRKCHFDHPILIVSDTQNEEALMQLMDEGASDFIPLPLRPWAVFARLARWFQIPPETETVATALTVQENVAGIVGQSAALRSQVEKVRRFAVCDASVLIFGETGTGKEVFARAIHYAGPRSSYPFFPINCAALPLELIENELFGHESGAFTGAQRVRAGLIEQAEEGTLFLDEIDALPMAAQAKLLRFLQEREYRPLGAGRAKQANVRVISASNSDLQTAIKSNRFRQDLYFRLNVLALRLPPLRERREDIPLLARYLLVQHASRMDHPSSTFTPGALNKLMNYPWPGNVRELENVIERALALSMGDVIDESLVDLPDMNGTTEGNSFKVQKARAIYEFEHRYLESALAQHDGNITRAAKSAVKSRRAFFQLLQKHNLTDRGR